MRRSFLLIAATFAAGTGFGYLLQPAPTAARPGRRDSAPLPPEPAPQASRPDPMPAPQDVPEGDGWIRGHVRDDAGAPLEGVLLVASVVRDFGPRKTPKGAAGPADRDIDELAREYAARERWQRAARRMARTAGNGSYEITGVAPVKWRVQAYKEGYQLEPLWAGRGHVGPGDTLDFAGALLVRVDVDVQLPGGGQPESALVYAEQRTGRSAATTSQVWLPSEPWIELKAESYEVSVAAGDGTARAKPQTIKVVPGATPPLRFEFEDRPGMRIKVALPDGIASMHVDVLMLRFRGETPPDPSRLLTEGSGRSISGREERVQWHDLQPGAYLVGARPRGGPLAVMEVVQVGTGTAECELRMPPLDARSFISVRARGPKAEDIRLDSCSLVCRTQMRSSHSGSVIATREDGVSLLPRPESNEAGGRYFVAGSARGLGQVEQECDPLRTGEVVLAFSEAAYVEVTFEGYAESPHAGWLGVGLANRPEAGYQHPGAEGRVRLGPVQPGPWDLVVYAIQGTEGAGIVAATIPLNLGPGERAMTIGIPVLHALTVRWPGGARDRSVYILPKAPRSQAFRRAMAEDTAAFERLPAGRYEIRGLVGNTEETAVEVDVPRQTEVRIR